MKIRPIISGLCLLLVCFNIAYAGIDAVKKLPPLTLKGGTTEEIESFKNSRTTVDLFNRYQFLARGIEGGGNFESYIKKLREFSKEDTKKWNEEMARPMIEPKEPPPNTSRSRQAKQAYAQAMKAYERRKENALRLHEKRQAVAKAYLDWLSGGIDPWIDSMAQK